MAISTFIQDHIQSYFTNPLRQEPTKKYNILSKKGSNHIASIQDFSHFTVNPVTYSFDDEHDFTTVYLTDAQAKHLAGVVQDAGDHLEEEKVFTLPPNRYFPKEATDTTQSTNISITATPNVLIDIP